MRMDSARWLVLPLTLSGCALVTLATQKQSWPEQSGTEQVRGPTDSVRVVRDTLGVPHIRGESQGDAYFALGFVHGQDRLFQADLSRRAALGELSEVLGAQTATLDGFMQGLGLAERARTQIESATFLQQALVESYTAGMNAAIAAYGKDLPVEYQLLGVEEIRPWRSEDALAVAYLQSWNLAENPRQELGAMALSHLPAKQLDDLLALDARMPPLDAHWDAVRSLDRGDWTEGFRAFTGAFGALPEASQASNNWIVGPEKSADGYPIVANDPHLGQSVPSLWHVADISWPEGQVAGVTLPGSPMVVIGHNRHIAWGLTNVMADYVDLAIVARDGDEHVIIAGEKRPLRRVESRVEVKDADPVTSEMWWTDLGPVISEQDAEHLVVLQWHALTMEDEIITGWFGLNRARSVTEAIEAMDRPMMVAQNLVVADVEGDWAWQAVGAVPKRKNHSGRVPYLASDPEQGWDGWLEELPGERQPERGWLATANYVPRAETRAASLDEEGVLVPVERDDDEPGIDPWAISTAYSVGWRDGRVRQLLQEGSEWTPEQVHQMQLDVHDRSAEVLLPLLMHNVTPSTSAARRCKQILDEWDLKVTIDSPAPAVWHQLQVEVLREALVDDIGDEAFEVYLQIHSASRNLLAARVDRFQEDPADEVDRALTATCQRMESNHGEDVAGWAWGVVHPLRLRHPFSNQSALLSKWNMPEVPFPGSGATIAAAGASWREGVKPVGGMASVRLVMPLSDLGNATVVYPGGQSGLPRHPDAQTHFSAFVDGRTLPLHFSEEDIEAHARDIQVLQPPGARSAPVVPSPAEEQAPPAIEEAPTASEGGPETETGAEEATGDDSTETDGNGEPAPEPPVGEPSTEVEPGPEPEPETEPEASGEPQP